MTCPTTSPMDWTVSAAFAIGLLVLSAVLDNGPDDVQAEADTAATVAEARAVARQAAQREREAQRLCADMQGPGAEHLWDAAGSLVCLRTATPPTRVANAL